MPKRGEPDPKRYARWLFAALMGFTGATLAGWGTWTSRLLGAVSVFAIVSAVALVRAAIARRDD